MNSLPDFPENLWDVNDVAKFAKLSKSWVYKAAEAGTIPCVRVGSILRFDPSAVKRFFQGAAVPAVAST